MKVMEEQRTSLKDIEVVKDDDFSFDGFQVVRGEFFSHIYEPSITFNNNKISLNAACIRKLPDVEYVQMLVNPDERKIAVKPCREDEKDSFKWRSGDGSKLKPKQITCKIFFAKIMSMMGWDPINRYKLLGKLIESNGVLLFSFDLNSPEIFQRKTREDGTIRASRIPQYPEEWKNQFGVPVAEHQNRIQVSIFNEYAVFGVKEADTSRVKSKMEGEGHVSETGSSANNMH